MAATRPATARRSPFLAAHAAATYLFLYAPIAVLVVLSFNANAQATVWKGFSVDWYRSLLADADVRRAAGNSLTVAALTTVISTVVGTLAAVALDRYARFRGRGATRAALYLPMVVPEVVLGVALLTWFAALGVDLGTTTVVLAHVVFTVSYVAVVVKARLAGLDRSVEEAAMDLGAGPVGAFCRATLPRLWPGVLAGALLVFTLSLDDYVVTSLVCGVGSQTFPVVVYSMLHGTVTPAVNAACTLLLAASVVLTVAAQWLLTRR
jgi:ABC-type spermidine/putrescine transport system permease subunit II